MRKAFVVVAFALLIASTAFAHRVVLDNDGDPYNGPDVIVGEVSDEVVLNVYFVVDPPISIVGFGAQFCNYDFSLEAVAHAYNAVPFPGWNLTPMTFWAPNCWLLQGFGSGPVALDGVVLVATVTIHLAEDCTVDLLEWDPMNTSWLTPLYTPVLPEMIGAEFVIGGTGTEESSWGAVKDLFR